VIGESLEDHIGMIPKTIIFFQEVRFNYNSRY